MGRLISQTSHHHLHNDDIRSARTNVSRTKISLGLPDEEFTDIEKEHKNTGSDIQLIKLIRVETDKKMTGKDTQELGKIRDNDVSKESSARSLAEKRVSCSADSKVGSLVTETAR